MKRKPLARMRHTILAKAQRLIPYGFTPLGAAKAALDFYGPIAEVVSHETFERISKKLAAELIPAEPSIELEDKFPVKH